MTPARGTLAWKLYVLGLVQLVLLALAVVGVGRLIGRGPPPEPPHDMGHGMHHHGPPSPIAPLLTFFFSGFVIVAVGSFLTARWIVRPLESLSRAATALGNGDLRARSGLTRKDELGEVGRAFDEMADRIQKLMLAEKELLANVSHELRTPIARIRVALDIAGEGDAEAGRMSMAEIGVDLAELEALIDDILTATRLEIAQGAGPPSGFALHVEEIGPEVIGERAADRFRARHPTRRLDVRIDPELPLVSADPVLLRRVLDNLLDNAHKYSPDASAHVALRVLRAESGVAFEVADRGMGIGAEDLPHVFAPFFRAERSRARGTGGVGLGLTLAKRIVTAHGGDIAITSAPGEGTTMRVVLPQPKSP